MELKTFFEELESQLVDAVDYNDFNIALKAISKIEEFLVENKNNLTSLEEGKLNEMLVSFKWVAFANLEDSECEELVLSHLDVPEKILPLDLEELMGRKLNVIYLEDERTDLMEKFYMAMEKSQVMFGKKQITVGGKKVNPTLSNWLEDFKNFPSKNNLKTSLDEVDYFNQSVNYRILDSDEKAYLQSMISLYDSLRNPVLKFRSLPETTDESVAFKDFNILDWLPGLAPAKGEAIAESSYVSKQEFKLPIKRLETNIVKPEVLQPSKKIDINEILSKGKGVRMNNQVTGDELRVTDKIQERKMPPVVPIKRVESSKLKVESENADRTNGTDRTNETNRTNLTDGANTTEDLNQIRLDIEKKKQMAQAEIDKRLESLKNRKANN